MTASTERNRLTMAALALGAALGLLASPIAAKAADSNAPVQVDPGALDALPASKTPAPGRKIQLRPPAPAAQNAAKAAPPPAKTAQPQAAPDTAGPPIEIPPPPTLRAAVPPKEAIAPAPAPAPPSQPPSATPAPVEGQILFAGESFDLSSAAKSELDGLAKRLGSDPHLYLQLVAYAAGGDGSEARRLSLSRALAARSYLLDRGVDGKQVDVRPLGGKSEPGMPPDRIDCVMLRR